MSLQNNILQVREPERHVCCLTYSHGCGSGMTTRDEYLKFAEECLRLAQHATDPDARARLLDMAQAWRDLSDKAQNPRAKKD